MSTSVIIPSRVTTIGNNAFKDCSKITSIILPESVSTIGSDNVDSGAFQGCTQLQYVKLPTANQSFTKIYSCTFFGCTSLTSIGESKTILSIIIPTTVTTIGTNAFKDCSKITSIILPESVSTIGSDNENTGAFQGCTQLQHIKLPTANANFTKISSCTFFGCTSLTSIGASKTTLSIKIPNTVTIIGTNAFKDCSAITSIILESNASLTTIENHAFLNCASLTSIMIPNTVTFIASNAFVGCTSLVSIYISNDRARILGGGAWGSPMNGLPGGYFFGAPNEVNFDTSPPSSD